MSNTNIKVESSSLEELILLGEDKLIDIEIEFPQGEKKVKAKAKIKPLTMKEVKNINFNNQSFETSMKVLEKGLFKQDGKPFDEELLYGLPVGVVNAISEKIAEISGVDTDLKKY
jgi:hypothetical protein